jgi:transmembrane sensor
MKIEDQDILARWDQGLTDHNAVIDAHPDIDPEQLRRTLDFINDHLATTPTTSQDWDDFQLRLRSETPKIELEQSPTPVSRRSFRRWAAAATVLFLMAIGTWLYQTFLPTTEPILVEAKNQVNFIHHLPDGSIVRLNTNASIAYDKAKWPDLRQVKLTGEAMFEVSKGSKFDVITPANTVSVLGTRFRVYEHHGASEVDVHEGFVLVKNNYTKTATNLSRGERTVSSTSGNTEISDAETSKSNWIFGLLEYKSTPLTEVITELARYYPTVYKLSPSASKKTFTGQIPINDESKAFSILFKSLNLSEDIIIENDTKVHYLK